MSLEIKRLFNGSLIYGLGTILQRFISVLLLPFFTHELSPAEYGVISLITLTSAALTGIFNLGTANSIGILFFREDSIAKRQTVILSTVVLLSVVGGVLFIFFFQNASRVSLLLFQDAKYASVFILGIGCLLVNTVGEPFLAYLRMQERSKQFAIQSLIGSFFTTLLSIVFILNFKLGAVGFFLAGLVGQVLMLLISLFFIARKFSFKIDFTLFAPLIKIGFPSIFGLFGFLVIDYGDRQLLQRFLGLDQLGIYSIGYNFGMVIMVVVNAFSSAWSPFFMSFIKRQEEARNIFGNILRYYVLGFGFITLFFFGLSKPFLTIMVAPEYINAYQIVGFVALSYMLRGSYLIFLPPLYFNQKLKYQSIIECSVAIINIFLNILLIPKLGILGSAIATLASYVFLPFFTYLFGKKYLKIEYGWTRILVAISLLCLANGLLFVSSLYLSNILLVGLSICIILFVFFIFYNFSITDSERYFFRNKFVTIHNRFLS